MVNFSKQYEDQLVPEWKVAFVDYRELKEVLKKIQALQSTEASIKQKENPLSTNIFSSIRNLTLFGHHHHHRDHGPIQVHKKPASSASKGEFYETELLEQFADVEAVSEFFSCLDHQLNKVNQFYRSKEKEFLERGESLKKQVDILIELETELKKQRRVKGVSYQDDPSISCHIPCDEDFTEKTEQQVEEEQEQEEQGQDSNTEGCEKNDHQPTQPSKPDDLEASPGINKEDFNSRVPSGRTFNYQGKNLKLNIPLTTPSRTFSALGYLIKEDLVNQSSRKCSPRTSKIHVNKTRLQHAGKTIRGALIELYKGLSYLETYRNLNVMAFAKILEKLDKVINKQVLPVYLKVVQTSYFNTSNEVMRLMEEAEELFIKQFANDNRRKAMEYLKPSQRKESHWVSFFNGIFTGCFLALLAGYIIVAHMAGMYKQSSDTIYMETVYPVFSIFSLLFLHFFLYGCNIFMWRKARINYCFIFELASTKELKYREVFLICTASMTAIVGVLFIHLTLEAKGYSSNQAKAVPGVILMFFALLLVCPFNIVYKTSRYRFIRVIKNIVFSPLYKVVMLDFFMADQLCSQVPLLRNLEYVACYYLTGSYKTQDYRYCVRNTYYRDLAYAVSFLPYYWRAMQCARRWFDEGEISHLTNLGKYVSAMLAAGAKVAYEKDSSVGYLCLVVAISSGATMYQLYWDFVKDWGLLQFDSRNPWLRKELMLRQKSIYYFSMGLNFVLRLVWLQTVLHLNFGGVDHRVTALLLAALEVIRRGQWNFYRLENEHLNNAGKFRVVKMAPLPFHEVDEED